MGQNDAFKVHLDDLSCADRQRPGCTAADVTVTLPLCYCCRVKHLYIEVNTCKTLSLLLRPAASWPDNKYVFFSLMLTLLCTRLLKHTRLVLILH